MEAARESRTLTVWIDRPPAAVYAFVAEPGNFPKWAAGLCSAIAKKGNDWIAETPYGPMKVRFSAPNEYGILDHTVITESGTEYYVPMRVVPNGPGSQIIFTLFRHADMPSKKFAEDAEWVARDLRALKDLLEAQRT